MINVTAQHVLQDGDISHLCVAENKIVSVRTDSQIWPGDVIELLGLDSVKMANGSNFMIWTCRYTGQRKQPEPIEIDQAESLLRKRIK